ncbi:MAG: translational GTPase TypA [Alphaproteobacteria bacterium]|nr:translational GTPase TypA [Rhodospirillaceae bacterium]MBT7646575.1 translational GTPase TypA [Rhodospirillaceae bacterium]MDG2482630.1 translational GTPase TypA [Alphaproteobacteria bacterium]
MDLRNIAIIAHVDHGKTTLVDGLLRQSGSFRDNQQVAERAMDSNDLERERGITILAKATSVEWHGTRLNIVDTPGHADFGGEVERILSMVDGVCVLVDASEGPLPQTKFVVGKALRLGLRPIVVINKIDRPDQRANEVHNEIFDLFSALDATDEQLDFPTIFASAKQGWATDDLDKSTDTLAPLFDLIVRHVPAPTVEEGGPFRMLATTLEADPFVGRILTGRIQSGSVKVNQQLKALSRDGTVLQQARVSKVLAFRGLERTAIDEAHAGDIIAIAGFSIPTVADTLVDLSVEDSIESQPIDPPTLAMTFGINDSPLAGQEGSKVTSRMIWDRLAREAEGNVALRISQTDDKTVFQVAGRGELQLGVLIETMRREGFELSIGRPQVVLRDNPETGISEEPIEEIVIDVDNDFTGPVVEKLAIRKGELIEMRPSGGGKTRMVFHVPSRGMIGYHNEFMTDTRGTGVMNRLFHGYAPWRGTIPGRRTGTMISGDQGAAVAYALWNLEDRGALFVDPGDKVYKGMVIGEHNKGGDLDVNPLKAKQLTNIRASGKDDAVQLTTPLRMSLEKAMTYISNDELVEVTPTTIRLRKRWLDPHERKRRAKQANAA